MTGESIGFLEALGVIGFSLFVALWFHEIFTPLINGLPSVMGLNAFKGLKDVSRSFFEIMEHKRGGYTESALLKDEMEGLLSGKGSFKEISRKIMLRLRKARSKDLNRLFVASLLLSEKSKMAVADPSYRDYELTAMVLCLLQRLRIERLRRLRKIQRNFFR